MSLSKINKITYPALSFLLLSHSALAQRPVEMASAFRESGKIYVVVAVVALIFLGIVAYLIYLDKRLRKWEKQQEKNS